MNPFKSSLLSQIPGVIHGFGGLREPIPSHLLASWEQLKPQWKQTHGTSIAQVVEKNQNCGEVDALWTERAGIWVGVATADCVPILLAERSGKAVAAIHAGWRGTLQKAVKSAIRALDRAGYDPSTLVAALGPSIQSCCFEVGPEVLELFTTEFPQISEEILIPKSRHIDLVAVNEATLNGLEVEQIDKISFCTKCGRSSSGEPLFHSYRREGQGTRQWSIIAKLDHSIEPFLSH